MINQTTKQHYKNNFKLAYPVVLSQLSYMLTGIADNAMVGQLGAVPLAAASLALGIFSVLLVFGIGISMGITPLVAAALGRSDKDEAVSLFKHGFWLNTTIGVVMAVVFSSLVPLLPYLKQPPVVVALAQPFLLMLIISLVPIMVFQSFRQFADGISQTKPTMYVSIIGNVLNILLNYLLIYGYGPIPALGALGAAVATLLARVVMAVLLWVYIFNAPAYKAYCFAWNWAGLRFSEFKKLIRVGVPIGAQMTFEVGAFSAAAIMVGWLGATELAAHQVALIMAATTYMMATGFSAAATIRVGSFHGSGDRPNQRSAGFTAIGMVMAFMASTALIFVLFNKWLPLFFIPDLEVVAIASNLLLFVAVFQVSDGVQVVALGGLRGMSDVRIPTAITLFAYWIVALPLSYFLGIYLQNGVFGIWLGLLTGLSVAAILLTYRFHLLTNIK